jgi:exopolysaccharide biosynthesis polyprenyl glycosylphosphotransferase
MTSITLSTARRPVDRGPSVSTTSARQHLRMLVAADVVAISTGMIAGLAIRFGPESGHQVQVGGLSYALVSLLLVPVWVGWLALHRSYATRLTGAGSAEMRRLFVASYRLAGTIAIVSYLGRLDLARGYLAAAIPIGTALLLAGRALVRFEVRRRRRAGELLRRVVVVGDADHAAHLIRTFGKAPHHGYDVIGVCLPAQGGDDVDGVPVIGTFTTAVDAAKVLGADTIAVTATSGVTPQALRRLSWELEGSGIDMVVAPTLTDVAGPRIHITPIAGLPLLHVAEPELGVVHRTVKAIFDRTLATLALLAVAPVVLGLALGVMLTSPGPAFFRQERVGRDGRMFRVWKLRTMHTDAEKVLQHLRPRNEADPAGLLFKMRDDPRVTSMGRWLRKFSLDELPQLINVVRGDMSLVGPRPPLPNEVAQYASDVERRLLVKPGITGLWQVSGRSDLSWEDSVRLDLYYVENWSLSLDLSILARTAAAVVRPAGAY